MEVYDMDQVFPTGSLFDHNGCSICDEHLFNLQSFYMEESKTMEE